MLTVGTIICNAFHVCPACDPAVPQVEGLTQHVGSARAESLGGWWQREAVSSLMVAGLRQKRFQNGEGEAPAEPKARNHAAQQELRPPENRF